MDNIFYQVLSIVTDPVIRAARFIAPRLVMDSHMPVVAFALVAWIWLAIVFWVLPEMCSSGSYDCSALMERKRDGYVSLHRRPSARRSRCARARRPWGRIPCSLRYSARTFSGSPSLNQAAAS